MQLEIDFPNFKTVAQEGKLITEKSKVGWYFNLKPIPDVLEEIKLLAEFTTKEELLTHIYKTINSQKCISI